MLISAPAFAALRHQYPLPRPLQIRQQFAALLVIHQRTHRHFQNHLVARHAGAIRTLAMPPAFTLEFPVIPVTKQRVVVWIRFQVDASPVASIASRWPASWHVLLPPERHTPVPAVARLHINFSFINKHGFLSTHRSASENALDRCSPVRLSWSVRQTRHPERSEGSLFDVRICTRVPPQLATNKKTAPTWNRGRSDLNSVSSRPWPAPLASR